MDLAPKDFDLVAVLSVTTGYTLRTMMNDRSRRIVYLADDAPISPECQPAFNWSADDLPERLSATIS